MIRFAVLCAVFALSCGPAQPGSDETPSGPVAEEPNTPAKPTPEPEPAGGVPRYGMQLSSPAFADGQTIPKQYTGDGNNISPPLTWTDAPEGTRCFTLICRDPDAPVGDFPHWVIYNLPPGTRSLQSGLPRNEVFKDGSRQGTNGFVLVGYDGPLPPPGKTHRYFFRLYALDARVYIDEPPEDAAAVEKAMVDHVLATATLMGFYGR